MSKYLNGKIYKLHSYENELVYIGSTIQTLSQRYGGHKTNFKKNQTTTSKILFQNSENVIITLIKLFPCNCKSELEAEERKYIENIECVNKCIPTRTQKEYRQDNKEKLSEHYKIYRQDNKEKLSEHYKIYYQNNKEMKSEQQQEYYKQNKEMISKKQQEYNKKNKEQLKEYKKIYYQNNKESVLDQKKVYYQNNKEVVLDQKKIYYQKNKEQSKIYYQKNKQEIRHRQYWQCNKHFFEKIKPLFYNI